MGQDNKVIATIKVYQNVLIGTYGAQLCLGGEVLKECGGVKLAELQHWLNNACMTATEWVRDASERRK